MKKIVLLLAVFIFLQTYALAVPDSVMTGPYKVSFDIGLNRSDYNAEAAAPKITESLGGLGRTDYSIYVVDKTDTNRFIRVFIKHASSASPIATPNTLVEALKMDNEGDSRISGLQTAARNIDGANGAIASAYNNPAAITVYQVLYQPIFDPTHVMVEMYSTYPWDEGTLALLKTIHVEWINATT